MIPRFSQIIHNINFVQYVAKSQNSFDMQPVAENDERLPTTSLI